MLAILLAKQGLPSTQQVVVASCALTVSGDKIARHIIAVLCNMNHEQECCRCR